MATSFKCINTLMHLQAAKGLSNCQLILLPETRSWWRHRGWSPGWPQCKLAAQTGVREGVRQQHSMLQKLQWRYRKWADCVTVTGDKWQCASCHCDRWQCADCVTVTGDKWQCADCVTVTGDKWQCADCVTVTGDKWQCAGCVTVTNDKWQCTHVTIQCTTRTALHWFVCKECSPQPLCWHVHVKRSESTHAFAVLTSSLIYSTVLMSLYKRLVQ